jgi:thioredoxin 1
MTSQDQSTSKTGATGSSADHDGAVADIGDSDFAAAISGQFTAVDLWAPWCGPCRRFMPSFERIADEHAAAGSPIAFARVNVDDNPVTAAAMAVHSIPTVILFGPDGLEVTRTTGVPNADDLMALLSHADTAAS